MSQELLGLNEQTALLVMGWKVLKYGVRLEDDVPGQLESPKHPYVEKLGTRLLLRRAPSSSPEDWLPSSDIAAAFQVEDRIAELGLQREYVDALMVIVYAGEIPDWDLVHASPKQRCQAALECVKEKAKAAGA